MTTFDHNAFGVVCGLGFDQKHHTFYLGWTLLLTYLFVSKITQQILANLCNLIPPTQPLQYNKLTTYTSTLFNLVKVYSLTFALNRSAEVNIAVQKSAILW